MIALHIRIPLFFPHNAFISSVSQRITFVLSLHQLKQWVIRNLQTRWLTIYVWWHPVSTVYSYVIMPTFILHIWSRGPCVPRTRSLLLCCDIISAQLFFYVGELEHGSWVFQEPNTKITKVLQLVKKYKQKGVITTSEMGVGSGSQCRGKHWGKHWFDGNDDQIMHFFHESGSLT